MKEGLSSIFSTGGSSSFELVLIYGLSVAFCLQLLLMDGCWLVVKREKDLAPVVFLYWAICCNRQMSRVSIIFIWLKILKKKSCKSFCDPVNIGLFLWYLNLMLPSPPNWGPYAGLNNQWLFFFFVAAWLSRFLNEPIFGVLLFFGGPTKSFVLSLPSVLSVSRLA